MLVKNLKEFIKEKGRRISIESLTYTCETFKGTGYSFNMCGFAGDYLRDVESYDGSIYRYNEKDGFSEELATKEYRKLLEEIKHYKLYE